MTGKTKSGGVLVEQNHAPEQTSAERAIQSAATDSLMEQKDEYARLVAEQRATTARLKELRAARPAKPQLTKLDRVVARQERQGPKLSRGLCGWVQARVDTGQPYESAFDDVLAYVRQLMQPSAYNTSEPSN